MPGSCDLPHHGCSLQENLPTIWTWGRPPSMTKLGCEAVGPRWCWYSDAHQLPWSGGCRSPMTNPGSPGTTTADGSCQRIVKPCGPNDPGGAGSTGSELSSRCRRIAGVSSSSIGQRVSSAPSVDASAVRTTTTDAVSSFAWANRFRSAPRYGRRARVWKRWPAKGRDGLRRRWHQERARPAASSQNRHRRLRVARRVPANHVLRPWSGRG